MKLSARKGFIKNLAEFDFSLEVRESYLKNGPGRIARELMKRVNSFMYSSIIVKGFIS